MKSQEKAKVRGGKVDENCFIILYSNNVDFLLVDLLKSDIMDLIRSYD